MRPAFVNPAHRTPMTCPYCYSKRIIRYGTLAFRHLGIKRSRAERFNCITR